MFIYMFYNYNLLLLLLYFVVVVAALHMGPQICSANRKKKIHSTIRIRLGFGLVRFGFVAAAVGVCVGWQWEDEGKGGTSADVVRSAVEAACLLAQ